MKVKRNLRSPVNREADNDISSLRLVDAEPSSPFLLESMKTKDLLNFIRWYRKLISKGQQPDVDKVVPPEISVVIGGALSPIFLERYPTYASKSLLVWKQFLSEDHDAFFVELLVES